jgi:hypothetical protein
MPEIKHKQDGFKIEVMFEQNDSGGSTYVNWLNGDISLIMVAVT